VFQALVVAQKRFVETVLHSAEPRLQLFVLAQLLEETAGARVRARFFFFELFLFRILRGQIGYQHREFILQRFLLLLEALELFAVFVVLNQFVHAVDLELILRDFRSKSFIRALLFVDRSLLATDNIKDFILGKPHHSQFVAKFLHFGGILHRKLAMRNVRGR
jgi:hypothetical protein